MSTSTRRRTHYAHITVDLDDFDEDTIADYLRDLGYYVGRSSASGGGADPEEALVIEKEDLARIDTLVLCGQRDSAREAVLQIVSEHIGRPL